MTNTSPPATTSPSKPPPTEVAARCHEIQTGLGFTEVPEFEELRKIGMAVIANVPYYETLYSTLGIYAADTGFNEPEQLSIELLCRLSKAPEKVDTLISTLGADNKLLTRAIAVGKEGSYVHVHRSRGRDIALSPTYFSDNADIYADMVAGTGSKQITKLMHALRTMQGIPLSLVQQKKKIEDTHFIAVPSCVGNRLDRSMLPIMPQNDWLLSSQFGTAITTRNWTTLAYKARGFHHPRPGH
ncbi:MAG: hypothetical protein WAN46_13245 [Gammaproteobacteria bacterium]|jgi:hypothetical protein